MDLPAYRSSAELFISELNAEHYRHYAGLKNDYEIEPIYERHGALFTGEAVESLRELATGASEGEDRTRLTMLLDFAVEGYVGQATKQVEAELARREASLRIEVDGEPIGFRQSAVVQANEPDRARRELIEQVRLAALERNLGPLYGELVERQHDCATALGWRSYREMCEQCKDLDLARLHAQTSAFATATDSLYADVLGPTLRRAVGIDSSELRHSDLARFYRAAEEDRHFPADRLVPALTETLLGLGVDVREQPGVVLDVEPRPNKSPRAFCSPVRSPGEVYLVIAPIGGWDDYSALLHEGGHTEHYAHVDEGLPFEFRYLGDNGVTESYAFLLQHLVEDVEWLQRRLGVTDAADLIAHARAKRLVYLRRYAAKLAYELELHGDGSPAALQDRYSELLGAALRLQWPRQTFLSDVDSGFYCACYLRAWALEAQLRTHLRERFGRIWFEVPEAGEVLRALWREGQRLSPEELLGQLAEQPLDFALLLDDLGLR
jgi:hypothetical protein